MLWFWAFTSDTFIGVEEDENGEAKLLRVSSAERKKERNFKNILFSKDGGKWKKITLDEAEIVKLLKGLLGVEDFDEIYTITRGERKLDVDSVVINDRARLQLVLELNWNCCRNWNKKLN